ncbi:MAG: cell wall-associated hydrolase [Caulobacteraceae bacterium]|nr:cell wall-associated hydrolase [Caulobacteraceae bacterium]
MSDHRLILARGGLASQALEGLVAADRYVAARPMTCIAPVSAIRAAPGVGAEQLDALVYGEGFEVIAERDGFALGRALRDSYVGHVALADLGEPVAPTHRIGALSAPVFARADIKSPVLAFLSLNALVRLGEREGRLAKIEGLGWVVDGQVLPIGDFASDPVATALMFLGAPYIWGGRDARGLDCSGLVQQALYACGRACPRDSDLQRAMGREIPEGELARGDLVFWPGHVAWMLDEARILHANAFHMQVAIEPYAQAVERIGRPVALRRA